MNRRRLIPVLLATLLSLAPTGPAMAQTGYVHLRTHPFGQANGDLGVYRTWVQGANGLVETFTEEFTPGQHTLALVEALNGPCRATAQNVSFTIKSGQWTEVDVPVTYQDCSFQLVAGALGGSDNSGSGDARAVLLGNGPPASTTYADCEVHVRNQTVLVWNDYHACEGTAGYGTTVTVLTTAGVSSCCDDQFDFVADENMDQPFFTFFDTTGLVLPDATFNHDLSVTRVGGSYGGQVMTAVFRIVNHGPDNAFRVSIASTEDRQPENGDFIATQSSADGTCYSYCGINWLPAGDSTTVTMRYSGVPGIPGDTTPDNFETRAAYCVAVKVYSTSAVFGNPVSDSNPANDTAPCLGNSVPVTVTLGGSTPANTVVQKGSTGVPMLAFALNPTSLQTLQNVTVAGAGTGNEQVDVTAVKLWLDKNGNGQLDAADSVLASGTFPDNNGSAVLTLSPGLAITGATNFLVTYDFNLTISPRLVGAAGLAMLPLVLLPVARRRRRRWAGVAAVMLSGAVLASCGGSGSDATGPGGGSSTYQVTLTGVNLSGSDVPNVSLAGATITVPK